MLSYTNTHITANMTSNTPHPSPSTFEVQGPTSSNYLPLRPDKQPFWRSTSIRINLGILFSILLSAAASIAALFTGKRLQPAKVAKHPDVASTIFVAPSKTMNTAIVTDVNAVVNMMTFTVSNA
jgi:hypothetical protein